MKDSPLAPHGRVRVRCLHCTVPVGERCMDCSAEGELVSLVPATDVRKAVKAERRRLSWALGGGLVASLLLWVLLTFAAFWKD